MSPFCSALIFLEVQFVLVPLSSVLSAFPPWFRKLGFSKEATKASAHIVRDKVSPVEISPLHPTSDRFQEDTA